MGAAMVVPETDDRIDKLVELFALTDYDLVIFYQSFKQLGKYNACYMECIDILIVSI